LVREECQKGRGKKETRPIAGALAAPKVPTKGRVARIRWKYSGSVPLKNRHIEVGTI